jgi:TRAP-type C4-dicarboxylate transport system substrate-binding protein
MISSERRRSPLPRALALLLLLFSAAPGWAVQTLKIATIAPEGSSWMREMRAAAGAAEQATEGRVKIRFYPGGVMGNDSTVLRKIRLGQLQGGAFTGSELTLIARDAQLYSLPFLFRDREEVDAVRAAIDPLLFKAFEDKGWKALSLSGVGFAYLMSNEEISDPGALASRKVWVPQNDAIAERVFRAGGVAPIPLPLPDVFTALQSGLIDTVGNTPAGAIALQWHGGLHEVLDLPLSYVTGYVVVEGKHWAKLEAADQLAVEQAFRAGGQRIDADNRQADAQALQALQGMGVKLVTAEQAQISRWEAIGSEVMQQMGAAGELSAATLAALLEARQRHRNPGE